MKPESYREVQYKCRNCKHCLVMHEYDEPDQYYCHIDGSDRPKCGSVAMDENIWDITYENEAEKEQAHELAMKEEAIWDKWAKSHKVDASGTCDEWEPRRGNNEIT